MASSFQVKDIRGETTAFLASYALDTFNPNTQHTQAYLSPKFLTRFHQLKYNMLMCPLWQQALGSPVAQALKNDREIIKKLVIVGTGALSKFLAKDGWIGGERWMHQLATFFAVGDLIQSAKARPPSVLRIMFFDFHSFGVYDMRILSALGAEVFINSNALHGHGNLGPFNVDTFVFDLATQDAEGVRLWDTDLLGAVRIGHDIGDDSRIGRQELGFCLVDLPLRNDFGQIYWQDEANVLKEIIFPSPEPLMISWAF